MFAHDLPDANIHALKHTHTGIYNIHADSSGGSVCGKSVFLTAGMYMTGKLKQSPSKKW